MSPVLTTDLTDTPPSRSCREGLDKAPVRRAASKKVAAAGKPTKKCPPPKPIAHASDGKVGPPLRIQPVASTGVKLSKNAAGQVVSAAKKHAVEKDDEEGEGALPSLDQLMSTRHGEPKTSGSVTSGRRGYAAPVPATFLDDSSDSADEADQLASSTSPPPPVVKSKSTAAPRKRLFVGDQDDDLDRGASTKRARISVREFASSSPIELPELDTAPLVQPLRKSASTSGPLFRRETPLSLPSPTSALEQAGADVDESSFGSGGRAPHVAFVDDGAAPDELMEHVAALETVEEKEVEPADAGLEVEGTPLVDEDDFDAWMASSVVIV